MTTAKAFISFASRSARQIVHEVLKPHPQVGLTTQQIYERAHTQFPNAKENPDFLPPSVKLILQNNATGANFRLKHLDVPHVEHPIRSMSLLKRTILEQMVERGDVERLRVSRINDEKSQIKILQGKQGGVETVPIVLSPDDGHWRWRLTPGHVPVDTPDPDPAEVREAQSTSRKDGPRHGKKKGHQLPPQDAKFGLRR
ncbi:hypothetical protein VNI00_005583 [Paramarasmius palmivorus]|uniref:Ribosomal protein/NADH dehydrogenase domain-containing protein n=1 Tax=Paramarasmius palmivorus TaxID=297713 RepID=A0AAW0DDC3_9AGAR